MPVHDQKTAFTLKLKKPLNGREAALHVLLQVWFDGAYTAIALNRVLRRAKLAEPDRRFATELANGSVKAKGTLDFLIGQLTDRPLKMLDPAVYCILLLGLYQIFYMERIPVSAACNESVNLAKRFGRKGTDKFVNGVLRNSLRKRETLQEMVLESVSLRFCHPRWLTERWQKQFGEAGAEALCRWDNEPPPMSLRVNTMVTTRDVFLQDLREIGCEAEVSLWCRDGVILIKSPGLPRLLETFPDSFYVQDESSMLPVLALQPEPGEEILDMCSAPGGKTTHMAALMQNKGLVTACDVYPHKLKLISENASRLKLDNIKTELQDGTLFRTGWEGHFDKVLIDAPCSGLGVLRRRAEARWTKSEAGLKEFPPLQRAILENGARYVKPGGILVYSTCTVEEEENRKQIERFLSEHKEWTQVGFNHPRTGETVKELQLLPQRDGIDGFYLTALQKK